jgi:HAD superfamily hydrolase (TIGR01490 family)
MKKVAIFDIDGTIFRSSLLIETTEALIQEGLFPIKAQEMYHDAYRNWLDRKGSYDEYIRGVINAFDTYIEGLMREDFLRISQKVVAFHQNRVYRYTRDLVHELHKKKYYIIAISNSPKELVDEFCKTLGFDRSYGRIHKVDEKGRLKNEIMHLELAKDKAKLLKRIVEDNNLSLKGSVGVGDSEADIPFLKLVDKPICFNPNSILYKHAKRAGWQVIVERKDVVYKL